MQKKLVRMIPVALAAALFVGGPAGRHELLGLHPDAPERPQPTAQRLHRIPVDIPHDHLELSRWRENDFNPLPGLTAGQKRSGMTRCRHPKVDELATPETERECPVRRALRHRRHDHLVALPGIENRNASPGPGDGLDHRAGHRSGRSCTCHYQTQMLGTTGLLKW